jgi:bifunctional UDP-N-acetylglucosamine pyrophosphorylase/glucosamine-1-phosphate N-acetyltransferase
MKSATSKVLHHVAGWSVLRHVLDAAQALQPERIILVTSPDGEAIIREGNAHCPTLLHATQTQADGTGGAVRAALPTLHDFHGNILILYGDSPLMRPSTLQELMDTLAHSSLVITSMQPHDPAQYGRIILNDDGTVRDIVEYNDATQEQRSITLCNAGFMAMTSDTLKECLPRIQNHNAKNEYYLTDIVKIAREAGIVARHVLVAQDETLGINDRRELAAAEAQMQQRLRAHHLSCGVSMIAPETVYFSMDTIIERDVLIHPFVVFGAGVHIKEGSEIKSFSHIEGAHLAQDVTVGPFVRLRTGTQLEPQVHIGNFVEVKNATLHEGVKAGHLSYLGDAEIGAGTNIGAGTITCNYDGKNKHKTTIGERVFVGSDTAFVAPVTIGDDVTIAAGSVITEDIPQDALGIARSRQVIKKEWKQ